MAAVLQHACWWWCNHMVSGCGCGIATAACVGGELQCAHSAANTSQKQDVWVLLARLRPSLCLFCCRILVGMGPTATLTAIQTATATTGRDC